MHTHAHTRTHTRTHHTNWHHGQICKKLSRWATVIKERGRQMWSSINRDIHIVYTIDTTSCNKSMRAFGSAVFVQFTSVCRRACRRMPFPSKLPLSMVDLNSHLIHDSKDPSKPATQTASRSVQPFLHRWLHSSVPVLYNGLPLSPQNCPFPWGCGHPSNTCFLEPTRVLSANGISISSAVLAWLTSAIDRQTDRQTTLLGR